MSKSGEKAMEGIETVVLTGGSSGIGKSLLQALHGLNKTINIANLSRSEPNIIPGGANYKHFRTDLSDFEDLKRSFSELDLWLNDLDATGPLLLINNSGFGCYGEFPSPSLEANLRMVDLNVRAVLHLTGLFLPRIRKQGGGVANIASTASFQPLPYMSAYAATKAFLLNWGLAINQEMKRHGSFCLTVCPGPTSTEFFERAGFSGDPSKGLGQTPEQVVETLFRALIRRKSLTTSGFLNWILAGAGGTLPRRWIAPLTERMIRGIRLDQYQKE